MENLVDGDSEQHPEQLVTFPDEDSTPTEERDLSDLSVAAVLAGDQLTLPNHNGPLMTVGTAGDVVKFEEKRTTSASKRKIVTNGFSSEQVSVDKFSFAFKTTTRQMGLFFTRPPPIRPK